MGKYGLKFEAHVFCDRRDSGGKADLPSSSKGSLHYPTSQPILTYERGLQSGQEPHWVFGKMKMDGTRCLQSRPLSMVGKQRLVHDKTV